MVAPLEQRLAVEDGVLVGKAAVDILVHVWRWQRALDDKCGALSHVLTCLALDLEAHLLPQFVAVRPQELNLVSSIVRDFFSECCGGYQVPSGLFLVIDVWLGEFH